MDLSFGQIILILIVTMIAAIDQFSFLESIYRPIVIGPIVGAIMGDLQTGLMIGASYELMMIGAMPVGGAQPPNAVIGGIMATVFGISLKLDVAAALPLAIPFALLGQYAVTALFTVVSPLMVKADKYAEEANPSGIVKLNYLTMGLLAVLFALIVLAGLLAGSAIGQQLTNSVPTWVFTGLSAAGKMMPALGFGMLLRVMYSKQLAMFIFVGFVLVAYMNLPLLAVAFIGVAVAVYDFQINVKNMPSKKEADTDGI
ncbi:MULTISPECIES: PTS mannose/fructose/sorbose/N-acetylgalactosamine transporter subunit IIC [unclassified Romboutsia]|uniref:PTS mannose/fructose/sorbose/N-acetylgalactosamine transporter subunit IIC n=1 Tax=unclassified Romboutsia TaxID=2626894 RepID=UPI000821EF4E|nr:MULTISPECIES: PTS sugar transporter subunit IIC [unclassified Romboutsia]SCI22758.1 PTS system N-acetylgalactosamine-specific EIIC component 1 [uncultured Clostridium sp.]